MPDLMNYRVVVGKPATVDVPQIFIEGEVVQSDVNAARLADVRSTKCLIFPDLLNDLSPEELDAFAQMVGDYFMQRRAQAIPRDAKSGILMAEADALDIDVPEVSVLDAVMAGVAVDVVAGKVTAVCCRVCGR